MEIDPNFLMSEINDVNLHNVTIDSQKADSCFMHYSPLSDDMEEDISGEPSPKRTKLDDGEIVSDDDGKLIESEEDDSLENPSPPVGGDEYDSSDFDIDELLEKELENGINKSKNDGDGKPAAVQHEERKKVVMKSMISFIYCIPIIINSLFRAEPRLFRSSTRRLARSYSFQWDSSVSA